MALHEVQLSEQDMQIQMLEATSYNGTYIWKIDHYSRRFQDAASGKTLSIYSPPFYVGRFWIQSLCPYVPKWGWYWQRNATCQCSL